MFRRIMDTLESLQHLVPEADAQNLRGLVEELEAELVRPPRMGSGGAAAAAAAAAADEPPAAPPHDERGVFLPIQVWDEIQQALRCSISYNLFRNPVVASDGHTYERVQIEEWFRRRNTSPFTREELDRDPGLQGMRPRLFPNRTLQSLVNLLRVYIPGPDPGEEQSPRRARRSALFSEDGFTTQDNLSPADSDLDSDDPRRGTLDFPLLNVDLFGFATPSRRQQRALPQPRRVQVDPWAGERAQVGRLFAALKSQPVQVELAMEILQEEHLPGLNDPDVMRRSRSRTALHWAVIQQCHQVALRILARPDFTAIFALERGRSALWRVSSLGNTEGHQQVCRAIVDRAISAEGFSERVQEQIRASMEKAMQAGNHRIFRYLRRVLAQHLGQPVEQ